MIQLSSQQQSSATTTSISMDHHGSIPKNMSTMSLERRLRQLKDESQQLDQVLTQKLASSQSGQNLLHIGTSLSSLPPDLHSLLQQLHPFLSQAELAESEQLQLLQELVQSARDIQLAERRVQYAQECADLYSDLEAAEQCCSQRQGQQSNGQERDDHGDEGDYEAFDEGPEDKLDYDSSLERAAHITLCLIQELHAATEIVSALASGKRSGSGNSTTNGDSDTTMPSLATPLSDDSERAQFVMKLAPRIRKLEAETTKCLSVELESLLQQFQAVREQEQDVDYETFGQTNDTSPISEQQSTLSPKDETLLLMLGHVMRGLALLGRGKDVESTFARVAIMPMIRPQISMGRIDEGGARGECAGLPALLQDVLASIAASFGPVLRLSEDMFDYDETGQALVIDLVTAGVWVPIATALMADAGIKMAIFSPGIASILQTNYTTLDRFLSQLADRLLLDESNGHGSVFAEARRQRAQDRIYSHPKTAEFSKRWNLPIYYQLRFGDCCSRLNKAIDTTRRQGWIADVFTGSPADAAIIRQQAGFEISLFMELYDVLFGLWRSDVILLPLAHRFLRGAIQLIGRTISFVEDGMLGKVKFGEEPRPVEANGGDSVDSANANGASAHAPYPTRTPYCWGESEVDVAGVAWELAILESTIRYDYKAAICDVFMVTTAGSERAEIREIVNELLAEAADHIHPLIDTAWNDIIVKLLTVKCAQPLAAVKGVAATYRMTNRPPPTQASPFVATILRPLKEFKAEFKNRIPDRVGSKWKHDIIVMIADQYAIAVEELIATVQRTEVALNNRRTRRTATGGMRDGEKVKLQVYLDYQAFAQSASDVGVDPATVIGISKLKELTMEGKELLKRNENGET